MKIFDVSLFYARKQFDLIANVLMLKNEWRVHDYRPTFPLTESVYIVYTGVTNVEQTLV